MFETSLQDFVGRYPDALAIGDDPIDARGIGLIIDRFVNPVESSCSSPDRDCKRASAEAAFGSSSCLPAFDVYSVDLT
jgi:hypothetical protein